MDMNSLDYWFSKYNRGLQKFLVENVTLSEKDFILSQIDALEKKIVENELSSIDDYIDEVKRKHTFDSEETGEKRKLDYETYNKRVQERAKYYFENVKKSIPSIRMDIDNYKIQLRRINSSKSQEKSKSNSGVVRWEKAL